MTKQYFCNLSDGFFFLLVPLFLGCGTSIPQIPATGALLGQVQETTVDSEIARYYLENYLQGDRINAELDGQIAQVYKQYNQALPSREVLKAISKSFSVDFAALFFATRLWSTEANKAAQILFDRKVAERKVAIRNGETQSISDAHYVILFVPGWDYKESGHFTGADFAVPRKLMTEIGLENHLVKIPSNGSVEENADFLTKEILRYSALKKAIILAGASSAGPAIHLTLGERLRPNQLRSVRAWINLGGILQGSPLLEHFQKWPRSWLLQIVLWVKGWEKESLLSMSAERSRERFRRLNLPEQILVFNYLGLSVSGEVSQYAQDKYPILRNEGPNDGLTLLRDIIAPGSITIVAFGSDHFFAEDPEINIKTVALLQTILQYLEMPEPK